MQSLRLSSFLALLVTVVGAGPVRAQPTDKDNIYWHLSGVDAIAWDVASETSLPHADNIEMSGKRVAAIVAYSVDEDRKLTVTRDVIFPQLRILIESSANRWRKYRAYLRHEYGDEFIPPITLEERTFEPGPVDSIRIDGTVQFFHAPSQELALVRTLEPSMSKRHFVETWQLTNQSSVRKELRIGKAEFSQKQMGQDGMLVRRVYADAEGPVAIEPGESFVFAIHFDARIGNEPPVVESSADVDRDRQAFLAAMASNFIVESPDSVLNRLFYFSKIRAAESIFDTRMGLVQSPGGGRYYTGVWANDQAEYSGPFFPYLGYSDGNTAAMNAYMVFRDNIPEGEGNFWSSFEMEGTVTCCGGDRGDAAMIAYGATHYALARGSVAEARELWPLISWSLDYSDRHRNDAGVVTSDSDEMEGRIATGGANLATSSLYYGALTQAALLSRALGHPRSEYRGYAQQAEDLRRAIESYFGAEVDGLHTYQYFEGHPYLRHWISLPLVMGIDDRREGTLEALFSRLWTDNGVKVEHNPNLPEPNLFWDRGTLYAFRGAFKAGAADRALEKLHAYSETRLLGFHVPYVVEAWPEGNMAHLAAESALYARIFTEGILGLTPHGFRSFDMAPTLPASWDYYNVRRIHAFGTTFDVLINRVGERLDVRVMRNGSTIMRRRIRNGDRISVRLN